MSTQPRPDAALAAALESGTIAVLEPCRHENLTIFPIRATARDERDFLTLDEGLRERAVEVTEREQEQVRELTIENKSDRPLFIQEGERVRGGRQDRTVDTSVVIAAKSGKVPLAAFCVEQGRWRAGASGNAFGSTATTSLSPKSVRLAAKVAKDQASVWREVAREKSALRARLDAPSATTSLNETYDSPEVQNVAEPFLGALATCADARDVVGVAFAVNGKLEEIDIYPGHALLAKLFPRLLRSFAVQAATWRSKREDVPDVARADVERFLAQAGDARTTRVNATTSVDVTELGDRVRCETRVDGMDTPVHRQVLAR